MKPLLSKRLQCCASMVPQDAVAADIGTDHGYLPVYLVESGRCKHVFASDLRHMPLEKAAANIKGLEKQITLLLSDGLQGYLPDNFDTVICAGMGGDCIVGILAASPWLADARYTLILQPQTSGNEVRRYLSEHGFSILEERLVKDGRFLYQVLRAQYGNSQSLTPGQQYVSPALLASRDSLLGEYLLRLERALGAAIGGIGQAKTPCQVDKLRYFQSALAEITKWRELYAHSE